MRTPLLCALAALIASAHVTASPMHGASAPPSRDRNCLTAGCHPSPGRGAAVHGPYREGRCRACHIPGESYDPENHSRNSFIAQGAGDGVCRNCHEEILRRAEAPFGHLPAADYDCPACHEPHSSPHPSLLRMPYSGGKAAVYDGDRYALCWRCHDPVLGTEKFTAQATGFRHGRRNSHYSHLRKRSVMDCPACHDPHGSGQPFMVRKRPPGNDDWWTGEMLFVASGEGGRCLGGCHRDISYRR